MNPLVADFVYVIGIAGLFYLNRDNSIRTSMALWLPVLYLWVLGSRPLSFWLGMGPADPDQAMLEGSPVDEVFFAILLIVGLCVLIQRGNRVLKLLSASAPILFYFLFCLFSVLWSEFPGVSCKRSIKAFEDLVMILIVLTDRQPVAALKRLFSRTAFILLPLSMLFIKYYPSLGRGYDKWTGRQLFNGVSLDKNMLGVITYVLLLGAVWRVFAFLRPDDDSPHRRRNLFAQGTLLAIGIYLLYVSNSDTSLVSFAVGTVLILATNLQFMRRRVIALHALVLLLVSLVVSAMFLGGGASAAQALGRDPTFSGRTVIWSTLIQMTPNPAVGAGFESFWLNERSREKLADATGGQDLNEAHDGYLEVYLELGWLGVGLIALIIIDGYRQTIAAFRRDPRWGGLLIAYVVSAIVYNLTEAGFRMMDPIWIFLLLAIIASNRAVSSVSLEFSKSRDVAGGVVRKLASNVWVVTREGAKGV